MYNIIGLIAFLVSSFAVSLTISLNISGRMVNEDRIFKSNIKTLCYCIVIVFISIILTKILYECVIVLQEMI